MMGDWADEQFEKELAHAVRVIEESMQRQLRRLSRPKRGNQKRKKSAP